MKHKHHHFFNHVMLLFLLLFGIGVMLSQVAMAQSEIIPDCALVTLEGKTTEQFNREYCNDVGDLVQFAINVGEFLFSIIGSVALIMFVYGGFMMILSFGKADQVQKGKAALVAAVVGLIIAFSGYAIVQFIQVGLGVRSDFLIF